MKTLLFITALFTVITVNAQESLKINWPAKYNIKLATTEQEFIDDEDGGYTMITDEYLPEGITAEDEGLYGLVITLQDTPAEDLMVNVTATQEIWKSKGFNGEVEVIESDLNAKNPWALYTFTMSRAEIDDPIVILYYSLGGDRNTYTCFISTNGESFPTGFVEEWSQVFKSSKIVHE